MFRKEKLQPITNKVVTEIEDIIGIKFSNHKLLKEALTHRSYANETRADIKYNEKLEFLGDSVVNFILTEYLYKNFPDLNEGQLAKLRASLVSSEALSFVATEINLGKYLQLGMGENSTGGRSKKSILENSFEALIGAIYLDAGIKKTKEFVIRIFYSLFEKIENDNSEREAKTILQEIIQKKYKILPEYKVLSEEINGNEHLFTVAVFIKEKKYGLGVGSSKKEAQRIAAAKTLEIMNKDK